MSNWRDLLDQAFEQKGANEQEVVQADGAGRLAAQSFVSSVLVPAFSEFAGVADGYGASCAIEHSDLSATIRIELEGRQVLAYTVNLVPSIGKAIPMVTFEAVDAGQTRGYLGGPTALEDSSKTSKEMVLEMLTRQFLHSFPPK